MFKAAQEYCMGPEITTRSLIDNGSMIEKSILDGHNSIKFHPQILCNDSEKLRMSQESPFDPRQYTKDLLKKCNILRQKN